MRVPYPSVLRFFFDAIGGGEEQRRRGEKKEVKINVEKQNCVDLREKITRELFQRWRGNRERGEGRKFYTFKRMKIRVGS